MRVAENGKKIFSVRDVNTYVSNILQQDYLLKNICVEGEVSSVSKGPTGHYYLVLKDCTSPEQADYADNYKGILRVNVWNSTAVKLKFQIKQGDVLLVTGQCRTYDAKSEYSINAVSLKRKEEKGWHGEAYAELKRRLGQEGIFDTAIKKPIPRFPRRVGVVISVGTNAYKDIMSVSHKRNPYVQMIVCDARAQGENARELIVRGIRRLDDMGVDTIIIGRGGGSREDLEVFDDEAVVRAIYEARTPIISGTGHEGDTSLADDAADLRVETPTASATAAIPVIEDILRTLNVQRKSMDSHIANKTKLCRSRYEACEKELHLQMRNQLENKKAKLTLLSQRLNDLSPAAKLERQKENLKILREHLKKNMDMRYKEYENKAHLLLTRLHGNAPTAKLVGGFGYLESDGQAVLHAKQVKKGDAVNITLHDGVLKTSVEDVLLQETDKE